MLNRKLFDNICNKYKLHEQLLHEPDKGFANVGRILYTMTEKEFVELQKEKK